MKVLSAEGARELDARTIAAGTPGIVLMERAAAAVVREVLRALAARPERGVAAVVLAGTGNNGGDGFEVARLLQGRVPVETLLVGDRGRLAGDAAITFQRLVESGGSITTVRESRDLEKLRRATLVVDALFGTGLSRPIGDGVAAEAVGSLSRYAAYVVAVDIPSGLPAGSGEVWSPHVVADLTVTFGMPKRAHVELPAAAECGRMVVADIGLLPFDGEGEGLEAVTARDVAPLFPRRPAAAHKGTFGRVAVLGGSPGMVGAPALAARAALRAGAGLVTVLAPEPVRAGVHALCPECTTLPLYEKVGRAGRRRLGGGDLRGDDSRRLDDHSRRLGGGDLRGDDSRRLDDHSRRLGGGDLRGDDSRRLDVYDSLAVGPGLGPGEEARKLLTRALAAEVPAVFDADALNLAGGRPELFASRTAPTVLTPHPGEAARLLGTDTAAVNAARVESARELARRSGTTVVLKGFRSVVAGPGGRAELVLAGNPGMASGGAGDVLTGIAGAFLARGFSAWDAARAAAFLHGAAGDLARERLGEEALIAGDLVERLGDAFWLLRETVLA